MIASGVFFKFVVSFARFKTLISKLLECGTVRVMETYSYSYLKLRMKPTTTPAVIFEKLTDCSFSIKQPSLDAVFSHLAGSETLAEVSSGCQL